MTGVMQETRHTGAATGTYSGLQGPKLQALKFFTDNGPAVQAGTSWTCGVIQRTLSATELYNNTTRCQEEFMAGPLQVCSLGKYGLTELCISLQSHVISNSQMWIL